MDEPTEHDDEEIYKVKRKPKSHNLLSNYNFFDRSIDDSCCSSSSPKESDIPLAARDSLWVGNGFLKPNLQPEDEKETEEDEEELLSTDLACKEELPIYTLFPNLRKKLPPTALKEDSDDLPVEIAKSLVGEKPNLDVLRKTERFLSKKQINLASLEETTTDEETPESEQEPVNQDKGTRDQLF